MSTWSPSPVYTGDSQSSVVFSTKTKALFVVHAMYINNVSNGQCAPNGDAEDSRRRPHSILAWLGHAAVSGVCAERMFHILGHILLRDVATVDRGVCRNSRCGPGTFLFSQLQRNVAMRTHIYVCTGAAVPERRWDFMDTSHAYCASFYYVYRRANVYDAA